MLLLGFYLPQSGVICWDGVELPRYNLRELRQRIGYIGQFPEFMHGSIRDNLLLGCAQAPTEAEISAALVSAAADTVVTAAGGLSAELQETASNLSGGERLRLALARELLRKCDVLILDEALASLDAENAEKVLATIRRIFAGRTVIFITHREALLRRLDAAYVLADGKLVSVGVLSEQ